MCGISGHLGKISPTRNSINEALVSMECRGPDGRRDIKVVLSNKSQVTFLFSRLSILDLSECAMQPMRHENLVIAMNGEIYNFRFLKRKIEREFGPQDWLSSGDVEVALRYIALKGLAAIQDFDGMFALAILDTKHNRFFLARDYFGEKPLYFMHSPRGLYWGSEPKMVWSLSESLPTINIKKLVRFLVYGYRGIFRGEDEFFVELKRIEKGSIYEFSTVTGELLGTKTFKKLPKSKSSQIPRQQLVKDLKTLVSNCVGRRLESDVPIAICLSGGIDSSILAAIAKKDHGVDLESYTIESIDPRYSETETARTVAKFLGIPHNVVKIKGNDFLSRMENLTRYHEAPISTISYFIQSFLMERIREDGFKVSLMGSGADEIFTGYYDHHLAYLSGLRKENPDAFVLAVSHWKSKILPLVRNPSFKDVNFYENEQGNRSHLYEGSEEMASSCIEKAEIEMLDIDFGLTLLRNRMLNELFYEVIPVILHEDDRNSMMNSIENRSPFLSYEILEFMLRVPDEYLIHNGLAKSLLREAFTGYLPDEILFAPRKIGFNASFGELCDVATGEFKTKFYDNSEFWRIFRQLDARKILEKVDQGDRYNKLKFNLVASKVFFDSFAN